MARFQTHGHKGWWPMLLHQRKYADGVMEGRECFVNMTNNQVAEPENGWNTKDLPYPTGAAVAPHGFGGSEELWESLKSREISGEVTQEDGRTVIRYRGDK